MLDQFICTKRLEEYKTKNVVNYNYEKKLSSLMFFSSTKSREWHKINMHLLKSGEEA